MLRSRRLQGKSYRSARDNQQRKPYKEIKSTVNGALCNNLNTRRGAFHLYVVRRLRLADFKPYGAYLQPCLHRLSIYFIFNSKTVTGRNKHARKKETQISDY